MRPEDLGAFPQKNVFMFMGSQNVKTKTNGGGRFFFVTTDIFFEQYSWGPETQTKCWGGGGRAGSEIRLGVQKLSSGKRTNILTKP